MLLQGKKQDVLSAYAKTSHVKSAVEAERKRSNFKEIELVNELTAISGFSLTVPQLASQQIHWEIHPSDCPTSHYTKSVITPLFDNLAAQLNPNKKPIMAIELLPSSINDVEETELDEPVSAIICICQHQALDTSTKCTA